MGANGKWYKEPFEEFLKFWSDYQDPETPRERIFHFSGKLITRMGENYTIENGGETYEMPPGVIGEFDPFLKKRRINKATVKTDGSVVDKLIDHYYRGQDFHADMGEAIREWNIDDSRDSPGRNVVMEFYHNLTALPGVKEEEDFQQNRHTYRINYTFRMDEERLREVAEEHLTDDNTLYDDLL